MEKILNILGQQIAITDHDGSTYLTALPASYDLDTMSIFSSICKEHFKVLDIGANIGLTAIALGMLCRKGKVVAIEPSPYTFKYLQENVKRSHLENIVCENFAAAAAPGEVEMSHTPDLSVGGFVTQKFSWAGDQYLFFKVKARTVDDYVRELGFESLNLMKIDVEGFELEVIRGAKKTIEKFKPIVHCEVNHWCLNVYRRVTLPAFVEELFTVFPVIFAVNIDLACLDLSEPFSRQQFYYEHVLRFAFINLLCGFDKDALMAELGSITTVSRLRSEQNAFISRQKLEINAMLTSKSWRLTAPLRKLQRFLRPGKNSRGVK